MSIARPACVRELAKDDRSVGCSIGKEILGCWEKRGRWMPMYDERVMNVSSTHLSDDKKITCALL